MSQERAKNGSLLMVEGGGKINATTIVHQNSVDFGVREYEESAKGRTSRNHDRGPSDMNSVSSKMRIYEHKVLS